MFNLFDPILKAIGTFLNWMAGWAQNYLIVLFIFAVLIELLFLPFGIKQQKNAIKQSKLRPKEMAIRKKYAGRNDRATQQKVAMEIQELYKSENYNQFAGCLPLLIQLPVIYAIYEVVINPLKYVVQLSNETITELAGVFNIQNVGRETIALLTEIQHHDLEFYKSAGISAEALADLAPHIGNMPRFDVFGINMGATPTLAINWLLLVPILTFGIYFASMKISRRFTYQPTAQTEQTGCSNNIMDIMMPLFSLFIAFRVPAAVGIYWIYKSIIGTVKQIVLSKAMPIIPCTEEDIKAAEKEMKGKAPIPDREIPTGPVKSLCDDDDDEPYPTFVGVKGGRYDDDSADTVKAEKEKPEEKGKLDKMVDKAPLKDDGEKDQKNG